MPRHDFHCPTCGAVREVYLPITQRATEAEVYCDHPTDHRQVRALGLLNRRMQWVVPRTVGFDCASGSTFKSFDFQQRQPDGSYRTVTVSSVKQMRDLERSSEQAARNGEGEAIRFRAWSQNDSNGDTNSFGPDPSVQARAELAAMRQAAVEAGARKREGKISAAVGETARQAAETLGPGVTEATASPLSLGE